MQTGSTGHYRCECEVWMDGRHSVSPWSIFWFEVNCTSIEKVLFRATSGSEQLALTFTKLDNREASGSDWSFQWNTGFSVSAHHIYSVLSTTCSNIHAKFTISISDWKLFCFYTRESSNFSSFRLQYRTGKRSFSNLIPNASLKGRDTSVIYWKQSFTTDYTKLVNLRLEVMGISAI